MILYRGTPEPEDGPEIGDFPCVFFTEIPEAAAGYANYEGRKRLPFYVQTYDVGEPNLFKFGNKSIIRGGNLVITDFLRNSSFEAEEEFEYRAEDLGLNPPIEWIEHLLDMGYDGYYVDPEFICLFEPYLLHTEPEFIDRAVIKKIPK